jgi:hypothetical protein
MRGLEPDLTHKKKIVELNQYTERDSVLWGRNSG